MVKDLPPRIDPRDLAVMLSEGRDLVLLDVREEWEVEICALEGSLFVPLGQLPERFEDLPKDRSIVAICHHGVRSLHAAAWLRQQGCEHVSDLRGGLDAWARQVDRDMALY